MAKPSVSEIQQLLTHIVNVYDDLDMRLKMNEQFVERIIVGNVFWKVGFSFDNEDNMTIRIIRKGVVKN